MMQGSGLYSGMRKSEHEWKIYIHGKLSVCMNMCVTVPQTI